MLLVGGDYAGVPWRSRRSACSPRSAPFALADPFADEETGVLDRALAAVGEGRFCT